MLCQVDQLFPQHLSHLVAGKLLDLEEPLRALVGAEALTRVSRQLFLFYITIVTRNYEGDDLLPPPLRWNAHDRCLLDRRVILQSELDLPRIDVQPAGDDH